MSIQLSPAPISTITLNIRATNVHAVHDNQSLKKALQQYVKNQTLHAALTENYQRVLDGEMTVAQYREEAPADTPTSWHEYLGWNQFSSHQFPRYFRPLRALVDSYGAFTNNYSEIKHATVKTELKGQTVRVYNWVPINEAIVSHF